MNEKTKMELEALWELVVFANSESKLLKAFDVVLDNAYISMAQFCALRQAIDRKLSKYMEV